MRASGVSFVAGFRRVMLLSATLALISAVSAWVLIDGKGVAVTQAGTPAAVESPPGPAGWAVAGAHSADRNATRSRFCCGVMWMAKRVS